MGDRVAGGWPEPQQGRVGQGLGGREAEWREIELAGHCVVAITTTQGHPRAQGESLDDLDGNPHQSGDETEPEGCVGLPLRRALPWSLEWEVVRRERARRLGHGTQALRAPDPAIVALVEQPRQHPAGAGDLAHETESRDRKSTRLNSSHGYISYAVFCLKKKKKHNRVQQSGETRDS